MAQRLGADYIIAVTLENVKAIEELRNALKALREDATKPITYTIGLTPQTGDQIAQAVEQKVAQAVEKGSKRGRKADAPIAGSAGTTAAADPNLAALKGSIDKLTVAVDTLSKKPLGGDGVGLDQKSLNKLDALISKLGTLNVGGAGRGTTTATQLLSEGRHKEINTQLDALQDSDIKLKRLLSQAGGKITDLNVDKVLDLLKDRANLLSNINKKQLATFENILEEELQKLHSAETDLATATGFRKADGSVDLGVGGDLLDKLADASEKKQALVANLRTRMDKQLADETERLMKIQETGSEEVVRRRVGLRTVNQTLKRSQDKMTKSFERLGDQISQSLSKFTDELSSRLGALTVNIDPTIAATLAQQMEAQLETAVAHGAAAAAGSITGVPVNAVPMPGGGRRRINASAVRAKVGETVLSRGATPLFGDMSNEEWLERKAAEGRAALERFRNSRSAEFNQRMEAAWSRFESRQRGQRARFDELPEAERMRRTHDARSNRVKLTDDEREVFNNLLGGPNRRGFTPAQQYANTLRSAAAGVMMSVLDPGGSVMKGGQPPRADALVSDPRLTALGEREARLERRIGLLDAQIQRAKDAKDALRLGQLEDARSRVSAELGQTASDRVLRRRELELQLSAGDITPASVPLRDLADPPVRVGFDRPSTRYGRARRSAEGLLRLAGDIDKSGQIEFTVGQARRQQGNLARAIEYLRAVESGDKDAIDALHPKVMQSAEVMALLPGGGSGTLDRSEIGPHVSTLEHAQGILTKYLDTASYVTPVRPPAFRPGGATPEALARYSPLYVLQEAQALRSRGMHTEAAALEKQAEQMHISQAGKGNEFKPYAPEDMQSFQRRIAELMALNAKRKDKSVDQLSNDEAIAEALGLSGPRPDLYQRADWQLQTLQDVFMAGGEWLGPTQHHFATRYLNQDLYDSIYAHEGPISAGRMGPVPMSADMRRTIAGMVGKRDANSRQLVDPVQRARDVLDRRDEELARLDGVFGRDPVAEAKARAAQLLHAVGGPEIVSIFEQAEADARNRPDISGLEVARQRKLEEVSDMRRQLAGRVAPVSKDSQLAERERELAQLEASLAPGKPDDAMLLNDPGYATYLQYKAAAAHAARLEGRKQELITTAIPQARIALEEALARAAQPSVTPMDATEATRPGVVVPPRATNVAAGAPAAIAQQAAASWAALAAAGGAGGAGGGRVPPAPPAGGGPSGPSGPGDWRDFAASMKQLEHTRLTGLATDLKDIAASFRDIKGSTGNQMTVALRTMYEGSRAKAAEEHRKTQEAKAVGNREWLEIQKQYLELNKARAANATGAATSRLNLELADMFSPNLGPNAAPGDTSTLSYAQVAHRFGRLENRMRSRQEQLSILANRYGIDTALGLDPSRIARQASSTVRDFDASRLAAMELVEQAAGMAPGKFAGVAPMLGRWRRRANVRGQREMDLMASMRATFDPTILAPLGEGQHGPALPKGWQEGRIATEERLREKIKQHRLEEERLAQAILQTASANLRATREEEHRALFVDRFAKKLQAFSMYIGAGALLYGGVSAVRSMFSQSAAIESELASIQGVVGNRTVTERNQIARGVMQAAIETGVPLSQGIQQAKLFAQTGMGTAQTVSMTRAAMMGQIGAGLEPGQAQEMLVAVDNVTRGAVAATDILDRISRVEARYAVTAQDLSVAIQRVGSMATQLMPGRRGSMDALDFVIGATTAQIERTRVGGAQSSTALKFMLTRLTAPETMRQLQGTYGIKLGASNTELRPLLDIFGDIARMYQGLLKRGDTGVAAQLLTAVAGQRQANQAAAIFGNWDRVMAAATDSARAWGDTQRRLEIQMDTLANHVERAKNAFFVLGEAVVRSTGIMSFLKGVTTLSRGVAEAGGAIPGLVPFAGAVGMLGGGMALTRLSQTRRLASAFAMHEAVGATAMTGGQLLAANVGRAAAGAGSMLSSVAIPALVIGGVLATIGAGQALYNRHKRQQEMFGPAEIDEEKIRNSSVYQNYREQALGYGMSVSQLQRVVYGAALAARKGTVTDPRFAGIGDFFTDDETKRATAHGFAPDMTKRFVENLTDAIPALRSLKEGSERTAAALQLLKGTATTVGIVTGYQQSYYDQQYADLEKSMAEKAMRASASKGDFALLYRLRAGASEAQRRTYDEGIESAVVGKFQGIFGPIAADVLNTVRPQGGTSVLDTILFQMRRGHTFGQSLDLTMAAFEPSQEGQALLARLKVAPGGTEAATQLNQIQALSKVTGRDKLLADTTRDALLNQRQLDQSILRRLRSATPLGDEVAGVGEAGGTTGSNVILASFRRAVQARLAEVGNSNVQAANLKAILRSLDDARNANKGVNLDILAGQARAQARGSARDRLLEPLLAYGTAEMATLGAGSALRRAGVSVDIQGERFQNAQSLLRGLYTARGQVLADYLRAASRAKLAKEFQESGSNRLVLNADAVLSEGERAAAPQEILQRTFEALSPEEISNLGRTAEGMKSIAQDMLNDKLTLGRLGPDAKPFLDNLLQMDTKDLPSRLEELLKWAEKRVQVQKEIVDAELDQRQLVELQNNAAQLRLQLAQQSAQRARQRGIRTAELLGGRDAGAGLELADIAATRGERIAAANLQMQSELRKSASDLGIRMNGMQLEGDWAAFLRARRAAESRRDNVVEQANSEASDAAAESAFRRWSEMQSRRFGIRDRLVDSVGAGMRSTLASFDTFKGPGVAPRLYKPLLDQFGSSVANSFTSALVGPEGLFGKKLQELFNSNIFMEADMIRQAHVAGIAQGFQAVGMVLPGGGTTAAGGAVVGTPLGGKSAMWRQLGTTALLMAGSIGGGALGSRMGVNGGQNYGSEGAQIGTMLGMMTPLGPLGGMIGGVLGGFLGGRFGKGKQAPPELSALERIERNTRETVQAIESQTKMLTLDNRLLNVPASFRIPSYAIQAGGGLGPAGAQPAGNGPIIVNVTEASDARKTADMVVERLRSELRGQGSFVSPRGTRS